MNQRHVVWQSDELTTCCQLLLSSINWRIVVDGERTTCICLTWSLEANVLFLQNMHGCCDQTTNDTVNACLSFSGFLYNIIYIYIPYIIVYIIYMSCLFKIMLFATQLQPPRTFHQPPVNLEALLASRHSHDPRHGWDLGVEYHGATTGHPASSKIPHVGVSKNRGVFPQNGWWK